MDKLRILSCFDSVSAVTWTFWSKLIFDSASETSGLTIRKGIGWEISVCLLYIVSKIQEDSGSTFNLTVPEFWRPSPDSLETFCVVQQSSLSLSVVKEYISELCQMRNLSLSELGSQVIYHLRSDGIQTRLCVWHVIYILYHHVLCDDVSGIILGDVKSALKYYLFK